MQNREVGSTKKKNPMTEKSTPLVRDTVQRTTKEIPSKRQEALSRLVAAYNNKAYGNQSAPLVRAFNADDHNSIQAYNHNGDRLGFVAKDAIPDQVNSDTRWTTRYGVGADNMMNPQSGYYEQDINTPLGKFDYGHDGDTAFAGFTPNFERTRDYYINGSGQPWSMDYARSYLGDTILQAGEYGAPTDAHYFADAMLPGNNQYIPDYYKSFNTPLGALELETNYDSPNTVDLTFNPNNRTDYFIQALANLLSR